MEFNRYFCTVPNIQFKYTHKTDQNEAAFLNYN